MYPVTPGRPTAPSEGCYPNLMSCGEVSSRSPVHLVVTASLDAFAEDAIHLAPGRQHAVNQLRVLRLLLHPPPTPATLSFSSAVHIFELIGLIKKLLYHARLSFAVCPSALLKKNIVVISCIDTQQTSM